MSQIIPAPPSSGVSIEHLATLDLDAELDGMTGRQLRMRLVTMQPGAVFGPVHDHRGRPGLVYVLSGTITDHTADGDRDYGPGPGWPENHTTLHWLENRGTDVAVEVSIDIVHRPTT